MLSKRPSMTVNRIYKFFLALASMENPNKFSNKSQSVLTSAEVPIGKLIYLQVVEKERDSLRNPDCCARASGQEIDGKR